MRPFPYSSPSRVAPIHMQTLPPTPRGKLIYGRYEGVVAGPTHGRVNKVGGMHHNQASVANFIIPMAKRKESLFIHECIYDKNLGMKLLLFFKHLP